MKKYFITSVDFWLYTKISLTVWYSLPILFFFGWIMCVVSLVFNVIALSVIAMGLVENNGDNYMKLQEVPYSEAHSFESNLKEPFNRIALFLYIFLALSPIGVAYHISLALLTVIYGVFWVLGNTVKYTVKFVSAIYSAIAGIMNNGRSVIFTDEYMENEMNNELQEQEQDRERIRE